MIIYKLLIINRLLKFASSAAPGDDFIAWCCSDAPPRVLSMSTRTAIILGFCLLASGALAQGASIAAPPFPVDVDWRGVALNGTPPPKDARPSLRIEGLSGRAFGSTGCNRWTASLTRLDDQLHFAPIAVTRRFCAGAAGEVERRFLAVLNAGPVWRIERGGLVLVSAHGRLRFRRSG